LWQGIHFRIVGTCPRGEAGLGLGQLGAEGVAQIVPVQVRDPRAAADLHEPLFD
jgi:hypothetical protein